jgi:hypothetical protein
MKKIIKELLLIVLLIDCSFSQAPDTTWTRAYGDSSHDGGSSIIQNIDGSFIVTGRIGTELLADAYMTDIWLFGIDAAGSTLWSYNYGGMGAGNIVPSFNDEFFLAAETFNPVTQEDMEILKINQNGDTLWTKTFYYSQHEYIPEIKNTDDGGLIILGYTYGFPRGALLIKTDEFGDSLWTKFFSDDIYILRPSSLELDDDDGYLFLISKYDSTFIYKTDSLGNLIWKNKVCVSPFSGSKLLKTEEGNFLILGTFQPNSDSSFIWVSLLNNNLETIWSKTYFSSNYTVPSTLIKSNTGGYLIIGEESEDSYSQTDGFIMKINDSGEIIWKETYGGAFHDYFNDILILENNEFLVVGTTYSFGAGSEDAWVLKFSADTTTSLEYEQNNYHPDMFTLEQNYPNPFNPSTKISWQVPLGSQQTLKIYDVLGNEVATLLDEYKPAGTYEVEFNISSISGSVSAKGGYASGVYFYQLKANEFVKTMKMILMK